MKTQNSKSANLTQNEQEVLKALVLNAQAEGDSGTEFLIDEVAAALNKSEKSVAATVGELQKKGLVDCYGDGYYFNGAVTEKGMAEFDKIEKTAKKETIERNLKTAKEFQDAIKDCTSEAAQEYKKQAQGTIEHYEAELAKLEKPNYDGLKKYLNKIKAAYTEPDGTFKVTASLNGAYMIPKNFAEKVMKFGYGFEPTGRDENGYCYVILTPNPVEEESKPATPQAEVGNEPEKKVAKSKHQIGDTKFYLGITYYVAGFNAKGTPLWRVKKDAEAAKAAPTPKAKKSLGVDWDYYDAPRFDKINKKYLAATGEGDNMASQIVAAVNKLVYKWYNDGDVFDNTHGMDGWANDLSSYANWLAQNAAGAKVVLDRIFACYYKHVYEHILKELADLTMRMSYLKNYEKLPKTGSIYDCDGDYEFSEESDYDD